MLSIQQYIEEGKTLKKIKKHLKKHKKKYMAGAAAGALALGGPEAYEQVQKKKFRSRFRKLHTDEKGDMTPDWYEKRENLERGVGNEAFKKEIEKSLAKERRHLSDAKKEELHKAGKHWMKMHKARKYNIWRN